MIYRIVNLLITLLLVLICAQIDVNAEFICNTDVHYKWFKPEGGLSKPPQPAPKATPENAADKTTEAANPEFTVFWVNVEKKAATEDEAKQLINKSVLNERAGAERSCLASHENLSGCIAAKYSSLAPSVTTLSFSAKKSMDEAIKADCDKQQGKCSGSGVAEVKCVEIKTETKAAEAPAKEAKKKK